MTEPITSDDEIPTTVFDQPSSTPAAASAAPAPAASAPAAATATPQTIIADLKKLADTNVTDKDPLKTAITDAFNSVIASPEGNQALVELLRQKEEEKDGKQRILYQLLMERNLTNLVDGHLTRQQEAALARGDTEIPLGYSENFKEGETIGATLARMDEDLSGLVETEELKKALGAVGGLDTLLQKMNTNGGALSDQEIRTALGGSQTYGLGPDANLDKAVADFKATVNAVKGPEHTTTIEFENMGLPNNAQAPQNNR